MTVRLYLAGLSSRFGRLLTLTWTNWCVLSQKAAQGSFRGICVCHCICSTYSDLGLPNQPKNAHRSFISIVGEIQTSLTESKVIQIFTLSGDCSALKHLVWPCLAYIMKL